jgi:hypothetical protein
MLSIRQWGEDWGLGEMQIVLADLRNGRPIQRIKVFADDGREVKLGDLTWLSREELAGKSGRAA